MLAKVFSDKNSQMVKLPKSFRFKEKEVYISQVAGVIVLVPKTDKWAAFINAIDMFSSDFMKNGRLQEIKQKRDI